MTQTPFQGGQFRPGESGDVSQSLQQSFTQQNRGWQRTAAMLKQNQEASIRNAGKFWGQLEEFAPTVNKFLATKHKDWQETQDAKGREWLHQNPVSEESKQKYLEELRQIGHSAVDANKMADEWELKGGDIWTSESFRSLSPHRQVAAVRAHIAKMAATYNPDSDPAVIAAASPTERVAALSVYRQNHWKLYDGFDERMVHLETRDKINEVEANSNRAWNATRTKEIKEARRAEMLDTLITGLKGENPAEAVLHAVNSQLGQFGGVVGESRQDIMTEIVTLVENGELQRSDLAKLEESEFLAKDGSKKKFGEYYKKEFTDIKIAQNNFLQKLFKVKEQTKAREISNAEDGYQKEMEEADPTSLTNKWFDDRQEAHKAEYGTESLLLNKLKAAHSVENIRYKDEEKDIKRRISMNYLTVKDLDSVSGDLRKKYLPTAQAMEKTHEKKQQHLEFFDKFPGTKEFMGNAIIGRDSGTIGETADLLQSRYLKLSRQLDLAGVENPEDVAKERVETWFRNTVNNPLSGLKTIDGYDISKLQNRNPNKARIAPLKADERKAYESVVAKARQLGNAGLDAPIAINGVIQEATAFYTKAELTKAEENFGQAGWYPDPKTKWLSLQYDAHPIAILNRSRKALGMKPLPENRDELRRWELEKREIKRQAAADFLSGNDAGVCTTRARKKAEGVWKMKTIDGVNVAVEEACPTKEDQDDLKNASNETGISQANIVAAMLLNRTEVGNNVLDLQDPAVLSAYNALLFSSGDDEAMNFALKNAVHPSLNLPGI